MSEPNFKLTPKAAAKFNFSANDVVNLFLDATKHWYSDKENSLYKKRARIKSVLLRYLRNKEDSTKTYGETYALTKFRSEWMGEGMEPIFLWTQEVKKKEE